MAEEKTSKPPPEVLPALDTTQPYIEDFIPVTIDTSERDATIADLQHLNTYLSCCHQALTSVRTIKGLEALVNATTKLIEVRRAVLKFPYGCPKVMPRTGRSIEVLD